VRALEKLGHGEGGGGVRARSRRSLSQALVDAGLGGAPVVTIEPVGTPGASATFTLNADEPATFECQLSKDGSELYAWAACTSPKAYTDLEPGAYVFSARGTDSVGLISTVVTATWLVAPPDDTTPPVVTITPEGTPGATATFNLTADEDPVTFECQLTRNAEVTEVWATCSSTKTYTALKVGTYVFSARAVDAAGNRSDPKSETWTVKKVVRP